MFALIFDERKGRHKIIETNQLTLEERMKAAAIFPRAADAKAALKSIERRRERGKK
jgi:hypothetical protein